MLNDELHELTKTRLTEILQPAAHWNKEQASSVADRLLRLSAARGWTIVLGAAATYADETGRIPARFAPEPAAEAPKAPWGPELESVLSDLTRRLLTLEGQPRTNALAGALDALEARLGRRMTTTVESFSDAISDLTSRVTDLETKDRDHDARISDVITGSREHGRQLAKLTEAVENDDLTHVSELEAKVRILEDRVNQIGVDHLNTSEALAKLGSLLEDAVTQRLGDALPALEQRIQELERVTGHQTRALDVTARHADQFEQDISRRLEVLERWVAAVEANQ